MSGRHLLNVVDLSCRGNLRESCAVDHASTPLLVHCQLAIADAGEMPLQLAMNLFVAITATVDLEPRESQRFARGL